MAEVSGSLLLLKHWRCPFVLLRSAHEMPRHLDLQASSAREDLRSLCGLPCAAYEWLLCSATRRPDGKASLLACISKSKQLNTCMRRTEGWPGAPQGPDAVQGRCVICLPLLDWCAWYARVVLLPLNYGMHDASLLVTRYSLYQYVQAKLPI